MLLTRKCESEEMGYDDECDSKDDADRPGHPEPPDDKSRKYWYHRKDETIHGSDFSIGFITVFHRYEDGHQSREGDHTDIPDEDPEHRDDDKYPEPWIPHIRPGRLREWEEHHERYRVEKEWGYRGSEHHLLLPVMIDEWAEPYTTEHIQDEIDPSEHPRDEDGLGLEVRPEGDSEPEKHIGKSCYRGVGEDVCEEGWGFHC